MAIMPPIDYSFTNMFDQEMCVTPRPNGRIQFKVAGASFLLEKAQASSLASAVLPGPYRLFKPIFGTDKPETVIVGTGSTEARVFVPTSDGGAERNLNFAKANLIASQIWYGREPERKAKAKREAEEKAAKVAAAQKAMDELAATVGEFARGVGKSIQSGRALRAYNTRYGTSHSSWEQTGAHSRTVDNWIAVVESIDSTSPKR